MSSTQPEAVQRAQRSTDQKSVKFADSVNDSKGKPSKLANLSSSGKNVSQRSIMSRALSREAHHKKEEQQVVVVVQPPPPPTVIFGIISFSQIAMSRIFAMISVACFVGIIALCKLSTHTGAQLCYIRSMSSIALSVAMVKIRNISIHSTDRVIADRAFGRAVLTGRIH